MSQRITEDAGNNNHSAKDSGKNNKEGEDPGSSKTFSVKDNLVSNQTEEEKNVPGDKKNVGTSYYNNTGDGNSGSGDFFLSDESGRDEEKPSDQHQKETEKAMVSGKNDDLTTDKYYFPFDDVDMATIKSLSSDEGKTINFNVDIFLLFS